MRNSALNQKMRIVDLGVATCIDAIIRNAETLLKDGTNPAEQANAKAEIRKHAHLYKQALEELLGVLDADEQGNREQGDFDSSIPHLEPLSLDTEGTLDDKLNQFHAMLLTFSTFPEVVQFCEDDDRLQLCDLAEVYKVYGQFLSQQFSHLHLFAQEHYNAGGGQR